MRIFVKRSMQFDCPAGQNEPVTVMHQSFADVPNWVAESAMFKLASQDKSVTVIENPYDESKIGDNAYASLQAELEAAKAQLAELKAGKVEATEEEDDTDEDDTDESTDKPKVDPLDNLIGKKNNRR